MMAELALWGAFRAGFKPDIGTVYVLPKRLDEQVARYHLGEVGAKLTTLTGEHAKYLGVPTTGPYKRDHYRYLAVRC